MKTTRYLLFFCATLLFFACQTQADSDNWPAYNGGDDRNHFSGLAQINTQNVNQLKLAWTYDSGGADTSKNNTQMQCNPIVVDGILYGVSADRQAFAIDAENGQAFWKTNLQDDTFNMSSRGVSYWTDGQEARIFFGFGAYLYALNAETGEPVESFGTKGKVYLVEGIKRPGSDDYAVLNTPPAIYKNVVVVGCRVAESASALLGDIRAYDALSGKEIWRFRTIPQPGEFGYNTWEPENYKNLGGANNWMGMAVDQKRGILFAPTGSAAFDFYGGNRKGDNLFANCLLALDIETGKRLWHFQTVHHDIWDRDIPAPPNLFSIKRKDKTVDVVSVLSKQGFVFVFNRETGEPIFPIEERAFPASEIEGELASKTQPVPLLPKPFTRQTFTENDLNDFAENKDEIIAELRKAKTGSPFIPLGYTRTVFYPGTDGGAQWGGAAVDEQGIMYIPAKQNPVFSSLIKAPNLGSNTSGKRLYEANCQACHGMDRAGNEDGTYPSLLSVKNKFETRTFVQLLQKGRGRMPAFTQLNDKEKEAIFAFLSGKDKALEREENRSTSAYLNTGYNRWYDSRGYPISRPPWGTLTAIDMNTAEQLWQVPLGEYPELTKKGIPLTGTDNYGGPAVTAGGLVFIAATKDEQIRAFDKKTGKQLWQFKLPAAGYASPSVFAVNGKQYLVIACGGGKLKTNSGSQYLAFSL
ncbi:pyrroloquinoline quinone-dependent dehydrogenase [Marinilongibacter aquaticus]|uniref:pyrroloquinoline quinone-dependent dehydrogenase n=1 Tax=Marinilongibacter aquaticus TaxID=2975157 RepID=UPI0021BDBD4D|nr:pyrroloquinoline quinone-dependent dehydrogenase [Marinilongibacter aquaticus]UBM57562.1 pyrroloquinoline quinone-dependent dehydrogenase [Marinilongibacter aquaticus]